MPGHIALLFTAPPIARQGVASAVLDDLLTLAEAMGAKKVTVDASRIAHPFFLQHRFSVVETEQAERDVLGLTCLAPLAATTDERLSAR